VKRYGVEVADGEASARTIAPDREYAPPPGRIMATGADATFVTSRPDVAVDRVGVGFDAERDGANKSQWQWPGRQHSIPCAG
jgi:hypothetical protein